MKIYLRHSSTIVQALLRWLVPGVVGDPGNHVVRPVVKELRSGRGCVTVHPQPMVVQSVRVTALHLDIVTLTHVLKV